MSRLLCILFIVCYAVLCHGLFGYDEFLNCRSDEEITCVHPDIGDNTCQNRDDEAVSYTADYICSPICHCKFGTVRADDGTTCITNDECDKLKCPGANEHFECGYECDRECATLDGPKNCSIEMWTCKPGCYCDDGFARADDGICIPIDNCAEHGSTTVSSE